MMMNIEVREFNNDEVDQIKSFVLVIFKEFGWEYSPEYDADIDDLVGFYKSECESSRFWVAVEDGRVIGTAGIKDLKDGRAKLWKMYVEKAHRSQGIGTRILNGVIEFCRDNGFEKIELITDPKLKIARKFYDKYGFVVTGENKEKEDLYMEKVL